MRLLIGNLPPGTGDDDLRAFVHKYIQAPRFLSKLS